MNLSWLLPESASTYAPQIDQMYYVILVITGVVFVITEGMLVWFLFKYRHREGSKAEFIHGNTRAEIIWTVIPFVIVMGIAVFSRGVWAQIKNADNIPADAMEMRVVAKQFEWNVSYPGADGVLDTGDDFTVRNRMDIPANRPVKIFLEAEDVIHSFWIRSMRVKQDAVPGMEIQVWFEATTPGEYPIGCAELCGTGHTRMRGTLTVHDAQGYQTWVADQIAAAGQ